MNSLRTSGRRLAVASLAAVLLISSCSDDDDPPASTAAEATTAPEATEATEPTDATEATQPADVEPGFIFGFVQPSSGLLNEIATAQTTALQLAVDDINEAGGVNGAPVSAITAVQSPEGDVGPAIDELLAEGANMILGPMDSTSAIDALPVLATDGSVACSASATAAEITSLDTESVFYRTALSDAYTVQYTSNEIVQRREAAELPEGTPYTVSILAREDDYGIGVGNGLAAALNAQGIQATVTSYNPQRVIFQEEAATIAAANPDVVVLVAFGEAPRQVDSLITAGVAPTAILGLDGLFNPELANRTFPDDPAAINGLRVLGATGSRAFIDRLVAAEGDVVQIIYGAQMYDCAVVGALAAQSAGTSDPVGYAPQLAPVTNDGRSCSTVADCYAQLAAGDDIDYEGVSGGIRFDENGDVSESRFTTADFVDGVLTEVSSEELNLDDLRSQEALAAAIFTTRLQQLLTALGFYTGPIDGQESDELTAAIAALQTSLGVPVTGVYDPATDEALRARYGSITGALNSSVIGIQQLLTELGFYTGPIDGVYSQETVDAIRALQRALGVPETGILDSATLQAVFEQGVAAGTPATTVPPPDTTAPPATPAPTPAPTTPDTTVPPIDPEEPTVMEQLRADARFTTFVELIDEAGYGDDEAVLGPMTLFAPTNDAFAAMDQADLDAIRSDPAQLRALLAYHLVDGQAWTLADLATVTQLATAHGDTVAIAVDGNGNVTVNNATTIPPETGARNGSIIPIDTVLLPSGVPA